MPHVPGLRSPYALVGRLVYFGRMLDKIRLHAAGQLPAPYVVNLGTPRAAVFDARCCRFLGIEYPALTARTLAGGADEEVLAWVESTVGRRSDDDCELWNSFMRKLGWRDDRTAVLLQRLEESGLPKDGVDTFFDFLERDEGRPTGVATAPTLRVLIVMGVSGAGKSTVGMALAEALAWEFADADAFHPPENVAKMSAGQALTDADRGPWLERLARHLGERVAAGGKVVLACSALRDTYRRILAPDLAHTRFVHLDGDPRLIQQRLENRRGHFLGSQLLPSQLSTLETPIDALKVDLARPPADLVQAIRQRLWL